jgi:hypothetical protein
MSWGKDNIFGEKYGSKVQKPAGIGNYSLCDIEDDRILKYLDDTIKEEDFMTM